jgi:PPOX class probable F420-dependent enzyme
VQSDAPSSTNRALTQSVTVMAVINDISQISAKVNANGVPGAINLDIAVIDAGLRRRIGQARVGHLATSDGVTPALVPVCFVLLGETVYHAIDGKPKSTQPSQLRRVKNLRANPRAALLVDHYVEDWPRLWYVLLRGEARLVDKGPEQRRAIVALRKKYPQYRTTVPLPADALVIALDVRRLWHWRASSPGPGRVGPPGRPA